MASKTKPSAIVQSLDNMNTEELARLSDRIHDLIEAKKLAEAITTDVQAPAHTAKVRQAPKRQDSAEWFETKIVKGHAYRYRRWWENGKKRSEYVGKA